LPVYIIFFIVYIIGILTLILICIMPSFPFLWSVLEFDSTVVLIVDCCKIDIRILIISKLVELTIQSFQVGLELGNHFRKASY
jgi:hypothetical protein